MKNHGQSAYEFLETLSFPRVSGSSAEKKAAAMICEEVKKIGFTPVIEDFKANLVEPVNAEFRLIDPEEITYEVTGFGDAGETPAGGLDVEFYYPRLIDEITLPKCKDKVVLLTSRPSEKDYKKLVNAGALAFLQTTGTMIDTHESADIDNSKLREIYHPYGKIPALQIRVIDAIDLMRRKPKRVHINLQQTESVRESQNVVVEVKGTEKADEIIVCGAHYDSTRFSCGAWDNGAGVAHMIELLKFLKDNPPKRSVRVIFFGSEEIGLKGSRAYLDAHEEDLEKIIYMVNSDVGGSILGGELLVSTGISDMEGYLHGLMCECGYSARLFTGIMSSDSNNFADFGIPTVCMGQLPCDGANYMHTRHDNFNRISADVLGEEIRFLLFLVNRLANIEYFPAARVIPKELRDKIVDYFGKDYCKTGSQTEFPDEPEARKPLF